MSADRATDVAKRINHATPGDMRPLLGEYAREQREALNRQIDLLEATQMTDEDAAAELARIKEMRRLGQGKPLGLDELRREWGLPPRSEDDPPRLKQVQVTVQCAGRGAGRVWIRWPDGETCEHPSLADARNCPKAAAS